MISNTSSSEITNVNNNNEISTLRKRFTEEEDKKLKHVVNELCIHNWEEVSSHMPGRTARQCRDRYNNYLFKEISSTNFTAEEDAIILQKFQEIGPHWVAISQFLVGRSGNNVKNRWYKFLCKIYTNEYYFVHNYYQMSMVQPMASRIPTETEEIGLFTNHCIFTDDDSLSSSSPSSSMSLSSENTSAMSSIVSSPKNDESENMISPDNWIVDQMDDLLDLDWEQLANKAESADTISAFSTF